MWTRDARGVYQSDLLQPFEWLWHGFGTRLSDGWPGAYTRVNQIHSDIVQIAEQGGCVGEGDALVTSTPGVRIGVRTADCVPVLLVDPVKRVVAAVHAGWRGTVSQVTERTVERMQQSFGCDPRHIYAAIGPCISKCCFEVGENVAAQFEPWFPDAKERTHIDLVLVNVRQLEQSGVPAAQIDAAGLCTVCCSAEFHSYRRDKEASGRMVAAIGISGE